jgi:hypothetical protein
MSLQRLSAPHPTSTPRYHIIVQYECCGASHNWLLGCMDTSYVFTMSGVHHKSINRSMIHTRAILCPMPGRECGEAFVILGRWRSSAAHAH